MAASNHPNSIQACMAEHNTRVVCGVVQIGGRVQATLPTLTDTYLATPSLSTAGELWVITQAAGTPGEPAAAMVMQMGGIAETTVPVAVGDGEAVAVNIDEYGMIRLAGYDYAADALRITDPAPAKQAKLGPIAHAQLTAAGSTPSTNIRPYENISFQILIAAINTSATVRIEGSHNGTNWFNLDGAGADTTYTANGTYELSASCRSIEYVRFTFVSEVGGAAVTLDVSLMAGN